MLTSCSYGAPALVLPVGERNDTDRDKHEPGTPRAGDADREDQLGARRDAIKHQGGCEASSGDDTIGTSPRLCLPPKYVTI